MCGGQGFCLERGGSPLARLRFESIAQWNDDEYLLAYDERRYKPAASQLKFM